MGCVLVDVKWCKENLGVKGWFQMGRITPDPTKFVWEDAFFCKSVLEKGGRIVAEPRVRCGHYDSRIAITDATADFLRNEYLRQRS
jgi:hypothetical protein